MKGIRILLASIRKADIEFNLINDNDKIVIGISGGKDSMALLYALNLYKKFSKANFELYPCMIDLGFPNFNPKEIKDYVNKLGYELKILDEKQVFTILKIQQEKQNLPNLPCSICSRMKKAIINKYAEKINANKVTFAHHKDDAIETLFLNEIYGGRFATFAPKMFLTNDQLTFIRPFIFVREKDILKTIKEEQKRPLAIADRNPYRYFLNEYNFDYKALIENCAGEAEPSGKDLSDFINFVNNNNVTTLFTIELSNTNIAKNIQSECNNIPIKTLYSCHNISKSDLDNGETYVTLMQKNVENLREALT